MEKKATGRAQGVLLQNGEACPPSRSKRIILNGDQDFNLFCFIFVRHKILQLLLPPSLTVKTHPYQNYTGNHWLFSHDNSKLFYTTYW